MAETHNICLSLLHNPEHTLFLTVFKKIFINLSWAAMLHKQIEFIFIQLKLNFDVGRERAQIGTFVVLHDRICKRNGDIAIVFFTIGFIGTATFIAHTSDTEVVISCNGWNFPLTDFVNHFVWPYIVTYQVTQTIDTIWISFIDIFKESFQSG